MNIFHIHILDKTSASMRILFFIIFISTSVYSQIITLQRKQCFGTCPVYKVSLYKNGDVTFEGVEYVKSIGIINYSVDSSIVNILKNEFLRISYFSLKDNYYKKVLETKTDIDGNKEEIFEIVTDLPTTYTSFSYKGKKHKVRNYYGAPTALDSLENKIDKLLKTDKLIN